MSNEFGKQTVFVRRLFFLGALQVLFFLALLVRLCYLQVVQGDKYKVLADDNRISVRLVLPPRGDLVDRTGAVIVNTERNYRLVIIPEETADVSESLEALKEVFPIDAERETRILKDVRRNPRFIPTTIQDHLSWDEVARVELNRFGLSGVSIERGIERSYKDAEVFAHVTGYVSSPTPQEAAEDATLLHPDAKTGRGGVEAAFQSSLAGVPGKRDVEVNARRRMVRELGQEKAQPAPFFHLSVNKELQEFAYAQIQKYRSGSVVVMDIHTGELLTLASVPGYDPNMFVNGISKEEWAALSTNIETPLLNKVLGGVYPVGSVFKIVMALAILESGISPNDQVHCHGALQLGSHRFHCFRKAGHGSVGLVQAIRESCDVYFYVMALRIGIDKIAQVARTLGLGQATGIEIAGERTGLVPDKAWKKAKTGQNWYPGDTVNTAIGQGWVLVTPLQLARMMAQVANGGYEVRPTIQKRPSNLPIPKKSLGFAPAALALVSEGLNQVVNHPRGTAVRVRASDPDKRMGGKTGTAQTRRISMAERATHIRTTNELPWELRDHGLFVAYAPVDHPQYAVAVVVDHAGYGGVVAAPVAASIIGKLVDLKREGKL